MRRHLLLCLFLTVGLCLTGCFGQSKQSDTPLSTLGASNTLQESKSGTQINAPTEDMTEQRLTMTIDGTAVDVQWEDNDTVAELSAYAQNDPLIVNASVYGGFEQVGRLPQSLSRNDVQMTTQPGDIVLYSGNQLAVFFGSNSWSYTKLGRIEKLSTAELAVLMNKDSAVIALQLKTE